MVSQLQPNNVEVFQTKCGKAIERYLRGRRNKSVNTERNYRSRIERFLKEVYGKKINTITSEELDLLDSESFDQYVEGLTGMKNTTVNNHISAIKSMYESLKKENIIQSDISFFDHIELKNDDSVEIEPMPIEVVMRYINEAGRELHNADLKQKLIKLAADQGLRLNELLTLTWKSFIPREDGVVIKGYGKRNKKFTKKMSLEVYEDILKLRKGASSDSKVFAPLSDKNVTDMMIRFRERLGYQDMDYSFHSLRKSAVTYFHKENGGDLIKTQRFAGHTSPNTTQIYIGADELGVTGMFSTMNQDPEAYKKISHEELLEVLNEMSYDYLHFLNAKIQQRNA